MLQDDFCAVSPYNNDNDFFQNYCLSTTCFLSWRIGNRTVSWILFLMFMSLFVMYMSPVQQIISWIRWKWCCFFLFFLFFSSLKKNDFCLAPLVFKRQVFQGTTNCCRTEQAAYVRRKQLHDVHGCLNWEVF